MKLAKFVGQFFQDGDGLSSSTRLAFIVWSLGIFAVWSYMCLLSHELLPLPQTVCEMTIIFMTGKVVHSVIEGKDDNNTPTVPPVAK